MTVRELLDLLTDIKDKSKEVMIGYNAVPHDYWHAPPDETEDIKTVSIEPDAVIIEGYSYARE